jgi:hypothetical protein
LPSRVPPAMAGGSHGLCTVTMCNLQAWRLARGRGIAIAWLDRLAHNDVRGYKRMPKFWSIIWSAQVWIAAAMTLLAGVPWTDCICPDGSRKALCSGRSTTNGSCCEGSCCENPADGKPVSESKKATCRKQYAAKQKPANDADKALSSQGQRRDQMPGPDGQVAAKSCSRVWAEWRPPVVTRAEQAGHDSCAAVALAYSLPSKAPQLRRFTPLLGKRIGRHHQLISSSRCNIW